MLGDFKKPFSEILSLFDKTKRNTDDFNILMSRRSICHIYYLNSITRIVFTGSNNWYHINEFLSIDYNIFKENKVRKQLRHGENNKLTCLKLIIICLVDNVGKLNILWSVSLCSPIHPLTLDTLWSGVKKRVWRKTCNSEQRTGN